MEVSIRKWQLSDAKDLAAALSNRNILNNLRDGIPYPYTERDAQDYISSMLSANENDTFAFAVLCDGKVVGSIGAFRQGNIHSRTAELGYYLAEEYWGRGIMTEAIRQLCAHLFTAPTFSASTPSRFPITAAPAGCWKRQDSGTKGP